jgi:hypothetical protein
MWVTVTGTPPTRLPVSSVISTRIEDVVACAWTWVENRTAASAATEIASTRDFRCDNRVMMVPLFLGYWGWTPGRRSIAQLTVFGISREEMFLKDYDNPLTLRV